MKSVVYMICGLPLSGKTTFSLDLQKKTGYKRLSLDEEYFKVVGNDQQEQRDFTLEKQIEESLMKRIAPLIKNGESLILDYCPWQKVRRKKYKKFIENHGGTLKLIYINVPLSELKQRAKKRNDLKSQNFQFVSPSMLDDFVLRFEIPQNEGEEVIT